MIVQVSIFDNLSQDTSKEMYFGFAGIGSLSKRVLLQLRLL
jgi:hypothetical protein